MQIESGKRRVCNDRTTTGLRDIPTRRRGGNHQAHSAARTSKGIQMKPNKVEPGHLKRNGRMVLTMTDDRKKSLSRAAHKRNAFEAMPKVNGLGWTTKQPTGDKNGN
jgi:hypothetical protein